MNVVEALLKGPACLPARRWLEENSTLTAEGLWNRCPSNEWRIWGARALHPKTLNNALLRLIEAEVAALTGKTEADGNICERLAAHATDQASVAEIRMAYDCLSMTYFTISCLSGAMGHRLGIRQSEAENMILDALREAVFSEEGAREFRHYMSRACLQA